MEKIPKNYDEKICKKSRRNVGKSLKKVAWK